MKKKRKKILVTGSAGLIGSETVSFFSKKGWDIVGIDNNLRAYFFGRDGDTLWNRRRLTTTYENYTHYTFDIRNQEKIEELIKKYRFDFIVHAAAQPSHDWAAKEPLTDFSINAHATLILLEAVRRYAPEAVFLFLSTNKVYGDNPNALPLVERATRYELPKRHRYYEGIDETMSIDNTLHSVFGASKVAADIMVQEYGKYFGLNTGVFRGGCLTGPTHSGAKLHGFLSYLVKTIKYKKPYTIFGYKGKQVRDNIHSYDLVTAMYEFFKRPKKGVVYNIGGSRHANTSMREAITTIEAILGTRARVTYDSQERKGDHQWYISDVRAFQRDYPRWRYRYTIDDIIEELCASA